MQMYPLFELSVTEEEHVLPVAPQDCTLNQVTHLKESTPKTLHHTAQTSTENVF